MPKLCKLIELCQCTTDYVLAHYTVPAWDLLA